MPEPIFSTQKKAQIAGSAYFYANKHILGSLNYFVTILKIRTL